MHAPDTVRHYRDVLTAAHEEGISPWVSPHHFTLPRWFADGMDIRGLFHWTAIDDYEWLHGFHVAFGIIDRDRRVKPSVAVLQRATLGRI